MQHILHHWHKGVSLLDPFYFLSCFTVWNYSETTGSECSVSHYKAVFTVTAKKSVTLQITLTDRKLVVKIYTRT